MKIVNLLLEANKRNIIVCNRRKGNTTRMVDLAIQLLFDGNTVILEDHALNYDINYIVNIIKTRLKTEHFRSNDRYNKYVKEGISLGSDDKHKPTLRIKL